MTSTFGDADISASMLRLRRRSPFFATLALYARFVASVNVPTAATDGLDVFYNPEFMATLPADHLDGVLLHEVLHAALQHVGRRGARNPERWNVAADVVVNGLIANNGLSLPEGALRDESLERYSVEEIYTLLVRSGDHQGASDDDLLDGELGDGEGADGRSRASRTRQASRQWAAAVDRAMSVARTTQHGRSPVGAERAFGLTDRPQLDWRALLWRFLSRTPTDFAEFDRRLMHRGLYLETLEATSIRVFVAIDTSGSLNDDDLTAFASELDGLLSSYPGIEAWLAYVDAEVYGPWPVHVGEPLPPVQGGGGTDFRPLFDMVDHSDVADERLVVVYLTDGYGDFPTDPPNYPVLWVVTPGGLDDDKFPFGDIARIIT